MKMLFSFSVSPPLFWSRHAVIRLEQLAPVYGGERRRLRVIKMRGTHFRGGYHDYVIRRGGLTVFPRLIAAEHDERRKQARGRAGQPRPMQAPQRERERRAQVLGIGEAVRAEPQLELRAQHQDARDDQAERRGPHDARHARTHGREGDQRAESADDRDGAREQRPAREEHRATGP